VHWDSGEVWVADGCSFWNREEVNWDPSNSNTTVDLSQMDHDDDDDAEDGGVGEVERVCPGCSREWRTGESTPEDIDTHIDLCLQSHKPDLTVGFNLPHC